MDIINKGWYLPVVLCCMSPERKWRPRSGELRPKVPIDLSTKSSLKPMNLLTKWKRLGKSKKKKSRYLIFRDPITGKRESKYPYKPRFQREEIEQSENVDLPSTNEGNFNIMITMLTYIKLIQSWTNIYFRNENAPFRYRVSEIFPSGCELCIFTKD